jgi:membrane-bound serine protease (ClpP class)
LVVGSRALLRVVPFALLLALVLRAGVIAQAPDAGAPEPPDKAYIPRKSASDGKPRDIRIEAPPGARVITLSIDGTIDLGLAAVVKRALESRQGAAALLLEINTLGGRVDAAIQIRDALLESDVKTIAFIHPRAISAGALIALACDIIAVSGGASIGAATPVQLGEGGAEPVEEKMVSYFRAEMRSTAEAKGRRGDIAEAMVDASVEIPGIDPAGKLLTLDTEGALTHGIADLRADSRPALLSAVGLGAAREEPLAENWAEKLVRFLTDPVVSGLLMSLGTLGILIELYSPGFGLPGALGLLCLVLFFGGHLLVNLAGLEELILFVVGLGLLAAEIMLIPGFGVAGLLGLLCIVSALVLTLVGLPLDVTFRTGAWVDPLTRVTAAMISTLVLMLLAARVLPRTATGRGLVLASATSRSEGFIASDESRLLGQRGTAESDLRPVGVARFGDTRVDVITEGEFVPRGAKLRVLHVEGARIVVRAEPDSEATV